MNNKSARTNEELTNTNNSLRELNQQLLSEIAERKRIEEALAESEAHFRTLANNGQALIWTSGTDKKCNYFNQPWLDFTGRAFDEEIGDGWVKGVHPDDLDHCISTYVNAFEKQEKFSMEYRVLHASGVYRWIQDDGTPRYNSKGEFIGYIGHCLDIQERKLMDLELQESKKLFSKAEAIGHVGSWEYNLKTKQFWASTEAKLIYGFNPEIDNFSIEEVESCIPEHEYVHQALVNLIKKEGKYELEFEIITKNTAESKTIVSIAELECDADGKPQYVVGVLQDITERKKAERALQESENRLQMIMEATKTGFWDWNLETDEWYASPMYYTMLGYEPVSGFSDRKIWFTRLHPDDRDLVANKINSALLGKGTEYTYERRMIHADGSYRWHNVQGYVTAYNLQGKPSRMVGTRIDISERKLSEELLHRSNRELKAISSCNQLLIHAEDEQTLLNEVCNIICNEAGYRFAWIGFIDKNTEKIVKPVAWAGHEDGYLTEAKITWSEDSKYGLGPVGQAIRNKKTCYIQDFATDPSFAPWAKIAADREYRSIISMPLKDRSNNVFGVMNIYSSEKNAFTDNEIRLLNELSEDLAFGILSLRLRNEHKQIEESLVESEEKCRNLVEASMDAIYIYQGSAITYLNPAALKLFGAQTPDQIIGKSPFDIMHPDYHQSIRNRINTIIKEKIPVPILEEKVVQLNGNIIDVEVAASPFSFKGQQAFQVVMRDISERKRIERKLIESKALYHSFVEHLPASVFRKDAEGRYIFVNSQFCKLKGLSEKEIIGLTPSELHDFELKNKKNHALGIMGTQYNWDNKGIYDHEQIMRTGLSIEQIEQYPQPDGTTLYFLVIKSPVFDAEGKVIGSQCVQFDITDQKLAEIKLLESERLLNESQRISGIGSYTLDIVSGNWRGSFVLDEMFGILPADDHSVAGWLAIVHPDDKEMMDNYFSTKIIAEKGRFDKEYRIVPKNNPSTFKWVHGIGEVELNSSGDPIKMIGTIQDITERKKTEDQLLKLTRAIEQSPDTIVITNTKGEIEYANPIIVERTGYSREELVGQNPRIFSSGHTSKEEYQAIWNTISSGHIWQGEFLNKKKNDELFWESTTISPVFDNQENITHYLAIKEDVTQQKKMTQELIEAKEKAEESDRLKSAFLANMSHEIRTPLNSIMGFASLMPDEESRENISQYAHIIVQNSEQLVHIIDGIVLYSKLQTHQLSSNPQEFNIANLLSDIQKSFNLPEYNKDVILHIQIDKQITIFADYDKIRQVLTNLVANAFKYTTSGEIIMGCEHVANGVKFFVKDTGIGISEKDLNHVFDRFFRGSNVDLARIRGTGLGLSIVKELVELMGGTIWAESEVGKGSTFYFTIPQ